MQIHEEPHKSHRIGWLRAAVLGANDGIVSTASLIIGVASAGATHENVLIAGVAALVAGAMSMAAGEYVSVSSQADTEKADLRIEKKSLEKNFELERLELAKIYEDRGLTRPLASEVASQLMEHDALGAHARDDIGISETVQARPWQAAASSALAFGTGAALPLATAALVPHAIDLARSRASARSRSWPPSAPSPLVPAVPRLHEGRCAWFSGVRWRCSLPPASANCSE